MPEEIERKFLVKGDSWRKLAQPELFRQGYLAASENCLVRLRTEGNRGVLTIKGKRRGIAGSEFEYEIPVDDAMEMLKLAISNPVEKIRYKIQYEEHLWEVDVFSGKNEGLIIAEIELKSENQSFLKPRWILDEVSEDRRFYNSYLSKHPFQEWGNRMA